MSIIDLWVMAATDYSRDENYKSMIGIIREFAECGKFEYTFSEDQVKMHTYNAVVESLRMEGWKVHWASRAARSGYRGTTVHTTTFAYKPPAPEEESRC
jgi:hypothetical protein